MKKIVTLSLISATALMAMYGEHAYLYKDPRIMGMGGANIAVGSYSTSLFSNPAGLAKISKSDGFVVDILGVQASMSDKSQGFFQDLQDAIDTEEGARVAGVLKDYSGEHFHIGVNNYTSVSKNSDEFAWSIGILSGVDANFMPHAQGSTNGGMLQTSSRAYGGLLLGGAKTYDTDMGRIDVGVGLKYISQMSYEGVLGVSELLEDGDNDIADTLQKKYEKESSGFGLDIGVNYSPFTDNYWNPTIGLSVLNIGSMNMDNSYGGQPTTVNLGISVAPEVSFLSKLVLAVDYADIFNANKVRVYNFSDTDEVKFSDYKESDALKRLRLGASATLLNTSYVSTTINTGLYQGAYTAGLNLELAILKFNLATYEEQIGTRSVSIADRRYMMQLGIGW